MFNIKIIKKNRIQRNRINPPDPPSLKTILEGIKSLINLRACVRGGW